MALRVKQNLGGEELFGSDGAVSPFVLRLVQRLVGGGEELPRRYSLLRECGRYSEAGGQNPASR